MISGYFNKDGIKNLFEYDNKVLKLKYENKQNFCDNLLKCKEFPNYNDIYFYQNTKYSVNNNLSIYYPDLVIDFETNSSDISSLNFYLDEIDVFYAKNLTNIDYDKFNYNGEIIITAKPFVQTDSDKYTIKINDNKMLLQFIVSKNVNNSHDSLSFSKQIRIEYDFKKDYSLIYKTIKEVQKFISFIAYRKNIIFKKIEAYSKNNEDLFYKVGEIEYIDKSYIERKTDIDYIKNHSYFYENIKDSIEMLFNIISSNDYSLLNIPKDDYMINIYNDERILMITSTFEDLFKLMYNDEVKHSEVSIKMRSYFYEFLEDNENNLELPNKKYVKFWNNLKKHVNNDNYSSKLNEVLKKDKYIDDVLKTLYANYNKEYKRSSVTERIEKIRNKCAHGEYRKIVEENDLYCIKALEIIVYYLQLKDIGVSNNDINTILYRVFRIALPYFKL